ncbi:MAG: 4-hydroxy-3-methylbut-2-enyl diphosphate reductase [Gammaproteobacteria bacterium]|nr:4-hydroxy-3-methylbut-2-enyl diphosphate reductase [Gammaproteobacteria bacterium]
MDIVLANPRGFCAGVDRAILIVQRALELFGAPIYVRHEIVHNRHVVAELRQQGAIFVDELAQVPDGATVIFSAHGVARAVKAEGQRRRLKVFDATCPLVTKVHVEVAACSQAGHECVLIGHAGHPEVEGTLGQYDATGADSGIYLVETVADAAALEVRNPGALMYVTQTTLSVDDTVEIVAMLQSRFPQIRSAGREDICYATQNRQDAVKSLAARCDLVLVVGSTNSSNSNRLREVALNRGTAAYLVGDATDIQRSWLEGVDRIGVTAGASTPEVLVEGVIARLRALGAGPAIEQVGQSEEVEFRLPRALGSQAQ